MRIAWSAEPLGSQTQGRTSNPARPVPAPVRGIAARRLVVSPGKGASHFGTAARSDSTTSGIAAVRRPAVSAALNVPR